MSEVQTVHSAAQSAAGYLYQGRLALLEALRYAYADSGIEIAIEKLDDVSFEKDGTALELLQTKHHLKKSGDLTDSSVDLWKTLRVWAETVKGDPSIPGRTRFALITTAQAPTGSAASHLRPADAGSRDPTEAEAMLMQAADASKNKTLSKAIAAFQALTPEMRKALLAAIEIIDGAPLIADMESLIEERLRMIAPRGKAAVAREQLEGWWWPRICAALQAETPEHDSQWSKSSKSSTISVRASSAMRCRSTWKMSDPSSGRIGHARRDAFRAPASMHRHWRKPPAIRKARLLPGLRRNARSGRVRNLLVDDEVGRFDRTLIEEWQPRFAADARRSVPKAAGRGGRARGRDTTFTAGSNPGRDFRYALRSSRFLNVGSYHILADDLRVGWHRDYESLCGGLGWRRISMAD